MDFAILLWVLRTDRLGLVEPIADFVRPAEGDGKDGGELGDALRVGHVGVFEVEATGFQGGEEGLDLPALGVDGQASSGASLVTTINSSPVLRWSAATKTGLALGFLASERRLALERMRFPRV